MKKIIYLILLVNFISCTSNEPKTSDSNAVVYMSAAKDAWNAPAFIKSTTSTHLSAVEVVKQTNNINYYNPDMCSDYTDRVDRDLSDPNSKDTINLRFKLPGGSIISEEFGYQSWYTKALYILFRKIYTVNGKQKIDTLAYIPNAVIREAYFSTKAAYDAGNINEVYSLFNAAYIFHPITGAEWAELKRNGTELR